jgi:hypothetical protein
MRCRTLLLIAAALPLAAADAAPAKEQGATIAVRDLELLDGIPGAVIRAIDEHGRGGRVAKIDAEKGGSSYEVQLRQGDDEWQLRIAADGSLIKDAGHEADLDKLPAKAKRAILEAAGGDRVVDVDRVEHGGKPVWAAQIHGPRGARTIRVDEDGQTR